MRRLFTAVPLLWWLVALAAAAVAISATSTALRTAEAAQGRWGQQSDVAVVRRPVPAGRVLTTADIHLQARPVGSLPAGALSEAPVGRVALVDLVPGEVLVDARLAGPGRTGPAALLAPGERGITITALAGERPPLRPGDAVDLVSVPADGSPASLLAGGRPVIAVDDETGAVTVGVAAPVAVAVAAALERGRVLLALAP